AGNGHSVLYIQKARWASEWHQKTLKLAWAPGDSFRLEGDRDYLAEIKEFLGNQSWRSAKEVAGAVDFSQPGIGAGEATVRELLTKHPDVFDVRTGDAAKEPGRSPKATIYALRQAQRSVDAVDSVSESQGSAEGDCVDCVPRKGRSHSERTTS